MLRDNHSSVRKLRQQKAEVGEPDREKRQRSEGEHRAPQRGPYPFARHQLERLNSHRADIASPTSEESIRATARTNRQ
jgi:hypothetical protein